MRLRALRRALGLGRLNARTCGGHALCSALPPNLTLMSAPSWAPCSHRRARRRRYGGHSSNHSMLLTCAHTYTTSCDGSGVLSGSSSANHHADKRTIRTDQPRHRSAPSLSWRGRAPHVRDSPPSAAGPPGCRCPAPDSHRPAFLILPSSPRRSSEASRPSPSSVPVSIPRPLFRCIPRSAYTYVHSPRCGASRPRAQITTSDSPAG